MDTQCLNSTNVIHYRKEHSTITSTQNVLWDSKTMSCNNNVQRFLKTLRDFQVLHITEVTDYHAHLNKKQQKKQNYKTIENPYRCFKTNVKTITQLVDHRRIPSIEKCVVSCELGKKLIVVPGTGRDLQEEQDGLKQDLRITPMAIWFEYFFISHIHNQEYGRLHTMKRYGRSP